MIIIREDKPEEPRLFDINPARQLDYTRSPSGFVNLFNRLGNLIQEAIARAPFEQEPHTRTFALPLALDLTKGTDCEYLWGLSGSHRRILQDRGLEFGSLYNFRYGWLSVGNLIARNIRVRGSLRFTVLLPNPPYPAWMGVMLRAQGHMASSGHLALLRANGEVAFTQEVPGKGHEDVDIGNIEGFDSAVDGFIPFDIMLNETEWRISIGSVERTTRVSDLR